MESLLNFLLLVGLNILVLACCLRIAHAISGGIDFDPLPWVVAKTVFLLALVSALELLPYGIGIALPFWWWGLLYLFRINLTDARLLFMVHLCFTLVLQFALLWPVMASN
jgi:hypothetical protein